jgi:phosphoribosylamine--glycine ligase
MKILIIGSGGREHAFVWKLKQSPRVKHIFCAPGNAGIGLMAENVPLKTDDLDGLLEFAKKKRIDLTVAGPEIPLVKGIVDLFEKQGLRIFGPGKLAAELEGSKVFAKNFMKKFGIPTAAYRTFSLTEYQDALQYVASHPFPLVIKADGLAAGKGAVVCATSKEAHSVLQDLFEKKIFGDAGTNVVVEEFMKGEEASVFALTDGKHYRILRPAQDHKQIFDGDRGKNTGGMGAYAPAPVVTDQLLRQVEQEIIIPTLSGMEKEGRPYKGCLYVGLMITSSGPKVVEYNCRFGDPETQVVLPLIDGDLSELLFACASGTLHTVDVKHHDASAVCVVIASRGYPDAYETGKPITGLDTIKQEEGVVVFHAGTKVMDQVIVSAGGRVLGVTAIGFGNELEKTIALAYSAVKRIAFDGAY